MEKIIVCVMGQNCEKFIRMCLKSIKDADAIIYCDGGSVDDTLNLIREEYSEVVRIHNTYNQEDPTMNGKQRNFYLKHLKENYSGYWALCIDADEVVEDLHKLKEWVNRYGNTLAKRHPCIHVKMRHLIGDLSHEDTTTPEHFCLSRLFKIQDDLEYPEVEHPVLSIKNQPINPNNICRATTIWHLAYCPNMWDIKKRYDNHMKKSNMHTPEYLKGWYYAHLFGNYPKKQFNPIELPKEILNEFGIDKDELYFANRNIEVKHFLMTKQWIDEFKINDCIEFGCGRAPFGLAFNHYGVKYEGIELSNYAVNNSFVPIKQGRIEDYVISKPSEFVIAFDVLEHLEYKDLDLAINNLIKSSNKYLLVSVPTIGDPNLEADKTHIIKEDREWWIQQFKNKNLKQIKTPDHFLFKDQILLFKK